MTHFFSDVNVTLQKEKNAIEMKHLCPEGIKLFSCSTQLSTKFILLKNVKMPTIVGILAFISRINTPTKSLKATI